MLNHPVIEENWFIQNPGRLITLPEPLNINLLPDSVKEWVRLHSQRLGVPPESIFAVFMTTAAAEVGTRCICLPRRHDKSWSVSPACLWSLIIGKPGAKKSPLISAASEPFREVESISRKEYETRLKENALRISKHEALCKKVQKLMEQNSEIEPEDEAAFLKAQQELEKIKKKPRRRIVHDTTVQKLGELIAENPKGS